MCLDTVLAAEGLVIDPCGHTLCVNCFAALSRSQSRGKCPVCRADVTKTIALSERVNDSDEFTGHFRPPS